MENQELGIQIQNKGRYLQSLDSVRFAESDKEALTTQARVELLTSLLFGQTIPIGEHQFLDSDGFIPNAVQLIKSLETIDNPRDRRKVESIFPFRVGIRQELLPIDNFIALKLGNTGYRLSKWVSLNNSPDKRQEIKRLHEEGKFKFIDLYSLLPGQEIDINELEAIRKRFLCGEQGGDFHTLYRTPTIMTAGSVPLLPLGLEKITQLDESSLHAEIEQQESLMEQGIEPSAYIDPELISPCMQLIEQLKTLKNEGLLLNNRSSVRNETEITRKVISDRKDLEPLLEIFDRLYNSAAAIATESYSNVVSSARDFDNINIRAATALAELAISKVPTADFVTGAPEQAAHLNWEMDTDFSVLHNSKAEAAMAKIPWQVVWYAYLDENWKKSLANLNAKYGQMDYLLSHRTDDIDQIVTARGYLDEAISTHVDNISRILKDSIVKIHQGSMIGQMLVSISTAIGSAAATYTIGNTDIISAGLVGAGVGLGIKLIDPFVKPYIPNIAAWNTSGQIRRTLKKVYKQY
jgi:hypothetical protein